MAKHAGAMDLVYQYAVVPGLFSSWFYSDSSRPNGLVVAGCLVDHATTGVGKWCGVTGSCGRLREVDAGLAGRYAGRTP
jgi:hypothetical protein